MNSYEKAEQSVKELIDTFGPDIVMAAAKAILQRPVEGAATATLALTVTPELVDLQRAIAGRMVEFMNRMEALQAAKAKPVPAEFTAIISPQALEQTIDQLELTGAELVQKGQAKEAASTGKGDLLKKKRTLETAIKLTEAEAIMKIEGSGKDAFVTVNGQRQNVGTEQMKDAYRRNISGSLRRELAEVESDIMAMEAGALQASDGWYTVKEASENVRAKAAVQAALLNFLTPRN